MLYKFKSKHSKCDSSQRRVALHTEAKGLKGNSEQTQSIHFCLNSKHGLLRMSDDMCRRLKLLMCVKY